MLRQVYSLSEPFMRPMRQFILVGGKRLDREFLSNLPTLGGTQLLLYRNLSTAFDPHDLVGLAAIHLRRRDTNHIIMQARTRGRIRMPSCT